MSIGSAFTSAGWNDRPRREWEFQSNPNRKFLLKLKQRLKRISNFGTFEMISLQMKRVNYRGGSIRTHVRENCLSGYLGENPDASVKFKHRLLN